MPPTDAGKASSATEKGCAPKVNVVIFSDAFAHRNGVGAYYSDLIGHLRRHLGEVELVCPGLTSNGKPQGLTMPLPGDPTQRLSLPGIPKACRTVRQVGPNVIVLASPGPYGLLGLFLAKRRGVKVVTGYHTQYDKLASLYWNRLLGAAGSKCLHWLDRQLFRVSRMVVSNSKSIQRDACRMTTNEVRLVGTPVDSRFLAPPATVSHETFGPVLFAGRLAPEKRLEAVIDAVRAMPDTRFVIAGDGPLRKLVERAAAECPNLDYVGWLTREELVGQLDRSELLVLPSRIESFGTVAVEAMARGRLVLVSEHCGIFDWPELAESLEVIQTDETLAQALLRLSTLPPADREAKSASARRQAVAFVEGTVMQWVRLLTEASGA